MSKGELDKDSTIRKLRIVRQEGGRTVEREVAHYNLDMVLAVGYRVRSYRGTQFRQWVTTHLREWEDKLDAFLSFNEREILDHAGKVSQAVAEELAHERYEEFDNNRRETEQLAADREDIKALTRIETNIQKLGKKRERPEDKI